MGVARQRRLEYCLGRWPEGKCSTLTVCEIGTARSSSSEVFEFITMSDKTQIGIFSLPKSRGRSTQKNCRVQLLPMSRELLPTPSTLRLGKHWCSTPTHTLSPCFVAYANVSSPAQYRRVLYSSSAACVAEVLIWISESTRRFGNCRKESLFRCFFVFLVHQTICYQQTIVAAGTGV